MLQTAMAAAVSNRLIFLSAPLSFVFDDLYSLHFVYKLLHFGIHYCFTKYFLKEVFLMLFIALITAAAFNRAPASFVCV